MSIKLAVLASGRGSNLEAILNAIRNKSLEGSVEVVLSDNPAATAIDIGKRFAVPSFAVDRKGLSREEHESLMLDKLAGYSVDYVVLAGYMRVLSPYFLKKFEHERGFYRVINIHPSLLPAFPGKSAYEDAFAYGVRVSGVTVHLVDDQVDHGPILAQEPFPRLDNDTLDTFKARGLAVEHELYPAVLQRISREGVRLFPQASPQKVAST